MNKYLYKTIILIICFSIICFSIFFKKSNNTQNDALSSKNSLSVQDKYIAIDKNGNYNTMQLPESSSFFYGSINPLNPVIMPFVEFSFNSYLSGTDIQTSDNINFKLKPGYYMVTSQFLVYDTLDTSTHYIGAIQPPIPYGPTVISLLMNGYTLNYSKNSRFYKMIIDSKTNFYHNISIKKVINITSESTINLKYGISDGNYMKIPIANQNVNLPTSYLEIYKLNNNNDVNNNYEIKKLDSGGNPENCFFDFFFYENRNYQHIYPLPPCLLLFLLKIRI